jgi:hypothetical protein
VYARIVAPYQRCELPARPTAVEIFAAARRMARSAPEPPALALHYSSTADVSADIGARVGSSEKSTIDQGFENRVALNGIKSP